MTTSREKRLKKYFRNIPVVAPHPSPPRPLAPKRNLPTAKMTQTRIRELVDTTQQLKKYGPGKRGHIFFTVNKNAMNPNLVSGRIILLEDGLYKIDRIAMGCSMVKTATIYCSPFDSTNMPDSKVLIQKN